MGLFGPKSKEYGDLNRQAISEIQETTEEVKQEVQVIQSDPFSGSAPGLVPESGEETQAKYLRGDGQWGTPAGGGGGTSDYEDLANKPAIDGNTLSKNSTAEDLGLAKKSDIPDVSGFLTEETDPSVPSWAKQPSPPNVTPNPTGTIISFFGESAPDGYLACDGSEYNKADYAVLAAHLLALTDHSAYEVDGDNTKFKVPDLRGEFLRGTGTNGHANMGDGASVGVHQDATMKPTTWISGNGQALAWNANNPSGYPATNTDSLYIVSQSATAYKAMGTALGSLDVANAYTSRPTSTSVLYCIKY